MRRGELLFRRRTRGSRAWALTVIGLLLASGPLAAQETTTIIVVRHVEKANDDPRDPGLSDAGAARALALADALADAGVAAAYTTPYRRTRDTARPLTDRLGIPLVEVPLTGRDIDRYSRELLGRIRAEYPGGTVLVVGHSNTVPNLIRAATGISMADLSEDDYGDLFILQLSGDEARLIRGRW